MSEYADEYTTRKVCKCGQVIEIDYHLHQQGKNNVSSMYAKGGYFKSPGWPNWVYCSACHRRHDLTRVFKRLPK